MLANNTVKRMSLWIVIALSLLEWLDFTLYLYLAKSVFAQIFFPPSSYNITLSFALFAAAYLARPLGGWLFGLTADRQGRRKPMMTSAALMGIATIGICLLPGYAQLGMWATGGLLSLRLLQGLALGGEMNTSGLFLIELHRKAPLKAGSLVAAGGAFGMFIGGALAALLHCIVYPNAWRVVFALIGGLSLWVCSLRKQLPESPEFQLYSPMTWASFWKMHWQGLLNIASMAAFVSTMVYLCNVYWVSFATDHHLWSTTTCAWLGALAQLGSALIAWPIACMAPAASCMRLLQSSMVFMGITAPLLFYFTAQGNCLAVAIMLLAYIVSNGLVCASLYYFLYLQLPSQYRCRGVSTVWALSASIGPICLPIAHQAMAHHQGYWFPGLMVSFMAAIGLYCMGRHTKKVESRPTLPV